jgi:hypothetical protein
LRFHADYLKAKNITYPGTTPLVTISAKESNSKPSGLKLSIGVSKTIKKSKRYPNTQNKKPFQNLR